MSTIRSRVFEYGNEKESEWPAKEASGKGGSFYWDKETQTFKEGYPPSNIKRYGEAPAVLSDTLNEPYYHEKAQVWVDSRSALRHADEATNSITIDKPIRHNQEAKQKEYVAKRSKERMTAYQKGLAAMKAGNSPVNAPDWKAKKAMEAETLGKNLGVDLTALPQTTERK